jgi:hypothetical protein
MGAPLPPPTAAEAYKRALRAMDVAASHFEDQGIREGMHMARSWVASLLEAEDIGTGVAEYRQRHADGKLRGFGVRRFESASSGHDPAMVGRADRGTEAANGQRSVRGLAR